MSSVQSRDVQLQASKKDKKKVRLKRTLARENPSTGKQTEKKIKIDFLFENV